MLLDWFTVAAQIVNFLILVALLKYFLYGRIIKAMDERQRTIASQLAEAEQQRQEAAQTTAAYRRAQQELEDERAELLEQAREDAAAQRQALYSQAREEIEHMQTRWHAAMQQEQTAFLHEVRQRASQQLVAIARRALADLADADLEQQMLTVFLAHLRTLDAAVWDTMAAAPQDTVHTVVIRSAFPLPHAARQQLQRVMQEHLGEAIRLRFETTPALMCGIEVQSHGQKIAWSLEHYVATLEEHLAAAFAEETGEDTAAAAAVSSHTATEDHDDPDA
jgi:F-type H+-transporting ATPase subunit b